METEIDIIDDFPAVRLLINIYMVKKLKSSYKSVNQERFIEDVLKAFREKNYIYSTKSILFTWKDLLDNYQYYKQHFTDEAARRQWKYFNLMDDCFEKSKDSGEKFKDPKWTFALINSLNKYKSKVLKQGLTMRLLQAIEDDFKKMENYEVTQKDIYLRWTSLRRLYRQSQRPGYSKFDERSMYFAAIKDFFEKEEPHEYATEEVVSTVSETVSQNELNSAIESITPNEEHIETKTQVDPSKCDRTVISPVESIKDIPNEKISITNTPRYTQFTIVMHDILLQCFKRNKTKIKTMNGEVDDEALDSAFAEFQKLGYNISKQSICNEWNDLTYRYELIKNTETPQNWPYFNDMNCIYSNDIEEDGQSIDLMEESPVVDSRNCDDENNIDDLVLDNVEQTVVQNQKIAGNDARITERLLNVYESNSKEFVEIKDILIERNLLREETNYLLNALVGKFNKKKR